MKSTIVKRTVRVGGRKTSVTLEDQFWDALKEIAQTSNSPLADLIASINAGRSHYNLSSAIRIFVLRFYQDKFMSVSDDRALESKGSLTLRDLAKGKF